MAVAAGLLHIHTHFGVHGSLRPVNCLVKEDGTTCVGDYGFGKIKELTGGGARISNTPGLYSYTAPEMLRSVRPLPSPLFPPLSRRSLTSRSRVLSAASWPSSRADLGAGEFVQEGPTPACDVYSFGVLLLELATLTRPLYDLDQMAIMGQLGFGGRKLLDEIPEDCDEGCAAVIRQCLCIEPGERLEVAALLEQMQALCGAG